MATTHDCAPTLTDSQVLEFCKKGFLILDGVVPDEINRRVCEYCDEHDGAVPSEEDWYIENVTLNPQAAGAIRSVLGKDFTYPTQLGNTRIQCPAGMEGGWHTDGGSSYIPGLDSLQVFYYPQDTPIELGPTELLPESHFLFNLQCWMRHYGRIRGAVSTAGSAGTIFLTIYRIWHRRTASTATAIRNQMKYWYTRTVPPERDWIREPGFEPRYAKGRPALYYFHREHHRAINDAAELFYWMCGLEDEYHSVSKNNLPVFWSK